MKNNLVIPIILTAVIVGSASFYAGTKYQGAKAPSRPANSDQIRTRFGEQRNGNPNSPSIVRGKILHTDESSLTVQLPDNSSKIIILADSTTISKSETGSTDDLAEETEVFITGQTNPDGSLTAQNIQIGTDFMRRREADNN
ncbi:MAG: hypothetical protein JW991_02485 [Candidatus Pacebacteria bacterium]|nr:hypothetical protein [Candidatus Paceibacterota bacterium]